MSETLAYEFLHFRKILFLLLFLQYVGETIFGIETRVDANHKEVR